MSQPQRIELGSQTLESQLATPNGAPLTDLSTQRLSQNILMIISPGLPEYVQPAPIMNLIGWFDRYGATVIPAGPERETLENYLVVNYENFIQIAQRTQTLPFEGMPKFKERCLARWCQILLYLKNLREKRGIPTR